MFKNRQWIFNYIVLLILLTGMCAGEVRADSFVCPQMLSAVTGKQMDAVLAERSIKSTELICISDAVTGSPIAEFLTNSRRTVKLSMIFLCIAVVSFLLSHFYRTECVGEFPRLSIRTAVLTYIHDTDGKK